jgi:cyclomaltodextrin glucanotransferase
LVYYGSETGFMGGRAEHAGNRNYFGQERIDAASKHRASSPVIPRFAAWPAAATNG